MEIEVVSEFDLSVLNFAMDYGQIVLEVPW